MMKHLRYSNWLLPACLVGGIGCWLTASTRMQGLLGNSVLLALGTCLVAIPPGVFLALVIAKTDLPGRRFLHASLVALLFTPLIVLSAAWQAAWGPNGWLLPVFQRLAPDTDFFRGWLAAIGVHAAGAVAWVTFLGVAALQNVPRELEESALQDATEWQVVWRVSLRRALPGVLVAALWIAVVCFSEISVTDLFQVRTFAEEVYTSASLGSLCGTVSNLEARNANDSLSWCDLLTGTFTALCLVVALMGVVARWLPPTLWFAGDNAWRAQPRVARVPLLLSAGGLLMLVVGIPVVSLTLKAGTQVTSDQQALVRQWSATQAATLLAQSPIEHRRELAWSCSLATLASTASTVSGLLLAWLLLRKPLLVLPCGVLLAGCLVLPGPLIGVGLIRVLNHPPHSWWAWLNWWYDHTVLAPVLAQWIRSLPLVTLLLWSQLASIPQAVLDSARTEGATAVQLLLNVVFPMRWPAVASSWCLAWILAMGELGATLLVVPPGVTPLSVRIFGLLHYGAEDRVSALCLAWGLVLGIGTIAAGWLLAHQPDSSSTRTGSR